MQRMTRAQRAAVGPGGGKPLVQPLAFTPEQNDRVARLKKEFGAKWVGTPRRIEGTHNMAVPMSNAISKSLWLFDESGKYLTRYTQRALFDERHHPDT